LLLSFIQSLILDHLLLADVPVPGFGTRSTNNIRCWSARGKVSFDLAKFNEGNYDGAVREAEEAETISTSNFLVFITLTIIDNSPSHQLASSTRTRISTPARLSVSSSSTSGSVSFPCLSQFLELCSDSSSIVQTAASLHDICRRFRKLQRPWTEFADYNAIQLNDSHPVLAIPELLVSPYSPSFTFPSRSENDPHSRSVSSSTKKGRTGTLLGPS
jgi:starch phosphorylase